MEDKYLPVSINEDVSIVNSIRKGLEKTGGYCPCSIVKNDDTKCMCKEFRDAIQNPDFEGYCHCKLYHKTLDK